METDQSGNKKKLEKKYFVLRLAFGVYSKPVLITLLPSKQVVCQINESNKYRRHSRESREVSSTLISVN